MRSSFDQEICRSDAGPGVKPISHRDTRGELGMGLL